MKHTEMPAWKLTASCIWNTFLASGKRHLLLTGSRGIGKTTLLKKLTGDCLPGITTWGVPRQAVYLRENTTGRQIRIGIYDEALPGQEMKMHPVYYGFAALGIPALGRCAESESPWISIDEIGYLELGCREYWTELRALMEKKRLVAVVRKQNLPLLQEILGREDVFVIDLDAPFGNSGCIIMASGLGKRFGGNKLTADFGGEPLIGRMLDATDGLFAHRVAVTRHADVAAYCRSRGVETVLHDYPHRSDTVRLGMEAMGDTQHWMFCPGDQPLLKTDTVMSLLLAGVSEPDAIWRPQCGEMPGAPILFPAWAREELLHLPEGKGGGVVARNHPDKVRYLPVQDPMELMDADTPEDLQRLLAADS